jgi:hypothetical protein
LSSINKKTVNFDLIHIYLFYELTYINDNIIDNNYLLTNMGLILSNDINIEELKKISINIINQLPNTKKFLNDNDFKLSLLKNKIEVPKNIKEELIQYKKDIEEKKRLKEQGKQKLPTKKTKEQQKLF